MSSSEKVSLKSYVETVEEQLNSSTVKELRAILMQIAMEVKIDERQAFLDQLSAAVDDPVEETTTIYSEDLLNDIEDLIQGLQAKLEEEEDWEYEYYDDEDDLGRYEHDVSDVQALFDQTNAAFDTGNLELAKKAYNRLFDIFFLEDDYGRGIRCHHLNSLEMTQVIARYLRSVYETAPLQQRPQQLFPEMRRVVHIVSRQKISLSDLIEISTKPLPDKEQFLDGWIAFLREQTEPSADYWLREAVRLSNGTTGLQELALSDGQTYPLALLDWITALIQEDKPHDAIVAIKSAQDTLSADLPIRASIADHLWETAQKIGDAALALGARWEAFYAKPQLTRLLDLWECTPDKTGRMESMQRSAERLKAYLDRRPRVSFVYDSFGDDADKPVYITESTLAHAYLLSTDWEAAYNMSVGENVLGWSNSHNPQGLVVLCFLGLTSARTPNEFPPNVSLLWSAVLENSLEFDIDRSILPRLKAVYQETLSTASLGSHQDSLFDWCLNTAQKRVVTIVANQHRKSYDKAATLIVACAEVLSVVGDLSRGESLVNEIRDRFPRHRAFHAELKKARGRRGDG